MARGQKTNTLVNPMAAQAMQQFKYEVASELGITPPQGGYWGEMTTRDTGAIGGHMVRKMVEDYQNRAVQGSGGGTTQQGGGNQSGTGQTGKTEGHTSGGPSRTQY